MHLNKSATNFVTKLKYVCILVTVDPSTASSTGATTSEDDANVTTTTDTSSHAVEVDIVPTDNIRNDAVDTVAPSNETASVVSAFSN